MWKAWKADTMEKMKMETPRLSHYEMKNGKIRK